MEGRKKEIHYQPLKVDNKQKIENWKTFLNKLSKENLEVLSASYYVIGFIGIIVGIGITLLVQACL